MEGVRPTPGEVRRLRPETVDGDWRNNGLDRLREGGGSVHPIPGPDRDGCEGGGTV